MDLCFKSKILLFAMVICIIFSLIITTNTIAKNSCHCCIKTGCKTCLILEIADNFLKTFKLTGFLLIFLGCLMLSEKLTNNTPKSAKFYLLPFEQKVRFNS